MLSLCMHFLSQYILRMMYLSDDNKIIQIPDVSFSGAEDKVVIDSSMAKIKFIPANSEVAPASRLKIYSFENQQLISGDVQGFFNDDAEKGCFLKSTFFLTG